MRMRFKSTLCLIMILLLSTFVLGAFYFVYKNYISYGADIKISGPLSINYIEGSKIKANGKKEVKFSIINDSQEDVYYYIEFKNPKNIKDKIIYSLSNNDDVNITGDVNNYNTIIGSYILIRAGEIENFILTLNPNSKFSYSLELNIHTENLETNTFADVILKNNEVKDSPLTTVGAQIATTEEGLIKSVDDYGTTYYFRGASLNNNVSINGINFKIVRINGDGTVRLVLDGQTEDLKKYYESHERFTYKESTVYTYLSSWIKESLKDYTNFLANHKYCNDNNIEAGNFFALDRIKTDNIPSFVCLGDKVLSKVGLLTADEVIYAGATLNEDNKNFYLYNENISANYYLMTSASLISSAYYPFMVTPEGKVITNDTGGNYRAVRPVITIIKTATVTGDGTVNNPYVLTNE
ncbi:MAG: hypothetical protein E7167_00315 [Firmicutes bacterium]|nr:hypothetical protein [Bacillota bacterium]